jgi:hypothetical protein
MAHGVGCYMAHCGGTLIWAGRTCCRRCELTVRLKGLKMEITRLLREIDFATGEPVEKSENQI